MGSYLDQTLSSILSDAVGQCGASLSVVNKIGHKSVIPYVARYKESSYGFLSRLMFSYGEWFYYNGKSLVVGNPKESTSLELRYDVDLTTLNLTSSAVDMKNCTYHYNTFKGEMFYDTDGQISGTTESSRKANDRSAKLYSSKTLLPSNRDMQESSETQSYQNFNRNRAYANLSHIKGESRTCAIKLGELVSVSMPDNQPGAENKSLGNYRVIEVNHSYDLANEYRNSFVGVPSGVTSLPFSDAVMPIAYPEMGKIKDNNDPDKQGRVKVELMWQQIIGGETSWIKVQSPDAGNSDKVGKNRGFLFVPEKDDLVMVAFEHGDPSRPFVTGSLFYKENSGGAADNNKTKSITTRSGVTITIDDDKGDGSITISDPSGNTVTLGGDKTISISAPDSITLSAKEITINGEDAINLSSKEITGTGSSKVVLTSDSKIDINSSNEVAIAGLKVGVEATTNMDVKGAMTTVDGSATAAISGTILNLN